MHCDVAKIADTTTIHEKKSSHKTNWQLQVEYANLYMAL